MLSILYKFLIIFCLSVFLLPITYAESNEDWCLELLKNEADLEKVYELSKYVFIAHVYPRQGVNPQIYNYELIEPTLKGSVHKDGFLTFSRGCSPYNNDSIHLFFLNTIDEKIDGANSVFFSLTSGEGYRWIADWIEKKISDPSF